MNKDNRNNNFLDELYLLIEKKAKRKTKKSYTNFLLKSGSKKIAKKIF